MQPLTPFRCQSCGLASMARSGTCPFKDSRRPAGTSLLDAGTIPSEVLYIRRGQVALSTRTARGREVSCAVRWPGAMLGLEGVLGRPVPYEAHALTDVVLCSIEVPQFRAWLGPLDSSMGILFQHAVDESVRRENERTAVEGTAVKRVARFLVETVEQGSDHERPAIPQAVLARVLGMRAETLSRALHALRETGVLAPGRKIHVIDLRGLRAAAAADPTTTE